jgi:hypothetical protein
MTDRPSLPALERLVAAHRLPEALDMALRILAAVDSRAGRIDGVVAGPSYPDSGEEDVALIFATRFAAVFGQLITAGDLKITATDYERLLSYYRWIDLIFSLSGFRTSDHLVRLIVKDAGGGRLSFQGTDYLRLLTVLTMNSFIHVDFDRFWRTNRVASAIAFFNYISSRYVFSRRAFAFRERLLEWIPERLAEVKFGAMTLAAGSLHALQLCLDRQEACDQAAADGTNAPRLPGSRRDRGRGRDPAPRRWARDGRRGRRALRGGARRVSQPLARRPGAARRASTSSAPFTPTRPVP